MNKASRTLSTPMEILEAALAKEKAAYRFYDTLLNNTGIEILREVIEHLREEEYRHILLVEKMMVKIRNG